MFLSASPTAKQKRDVQIRIIISGVIIRRHQTTVAKRQNIVIPALFPESTCLDTSKFMFTYPNRNQLVQNNHVKYKTPMLLPQSVSY